MLVAKRDGTSKEVVLGKALAVLLGGKPMPNCFLIARPVAVRTVDAKAAAEVMELERLHRL